MTCVQHGEFPGKLRQLYHHSKVSDIFWLCDSKQNDKPYRQALEGFDVYVNSVPCHGISDLAVQVITTMLRTYGKTITSTIMIVSRYTSRLLASRLRPVHPSSCKSETRRSPAPLSTTP